MGHLAYAALVLGAAEVEEQEVRLDAAADHAPGRHRGVVAAGDQRHGLPLEAQRIAAQAGQAAVDQAQAALGHLHGHVHLGAVQVDPGVGCRRQQRRPQVALHVGGSEGVTAAALCRHPEATPGDPLPPARHHRLGDLLEGREVHLAHLLHLLNAGEARQACLHLLGEARGGRLGQGDPEQVPCLAHPDARIQRLQGVAHVGGQAAGHVTAHGARLDGDLGEQLEQIVHEARVCITLVKTMACHCTRAGLRTHDDARPGPGVEVSGVEERQ